ncbi:ribonuclease HI [Entomobacter blattae]|uniref:Ribonuclease H n=1 Tax=Entomobacter blattae TaxID=2762277 RepID=A0A7H1NNI7_9PROT|nr:ribonuclease HI [Entomobacter blattae]QNT77347.1 Ribonuclease HI [Entomobacter blattae]
MIEKGLKKVDIWTDGGSKPNPGPGGWAALLRFGKHEKEISGFEQETTNNRMELTAAAKALETLKEPCEINLYTDSQYVRRGITEWSAGWIKRNWRGASNKPVLNVDLWQRVLKAAERHIITWHWVKGHAESAENNRVDELATLARKSAETQT